MDALMQLDIFIISFVLNVYLTKYDFYATMLENFLFWSRWDLYFELFRRCDADDWDCRLDGLNVNTMRCVLRSSQYRFTYSVWRLWFFWPLSY